MELYMMYNKTQDKGRLNMTPKLFKLAITADTNILLYLLLN